jgi:hypothetical protein
MELKILRINISLFRIFQSSSPYISLTPNIALTPIANPINYNRLCFQLSLNKCFQISEAI